MANAHHTIPALAPPPPSYSSQGIIPTSVAASSATSTTTASTTSSSTTSRPSIKPPPPRDDSEGHFIVTPQGTITSRYTINRLLGQGTFGKVAECLDRRDGRNVAVKVIRAVQKYRDAAKVEVRVLRELQSRDPGNIYRCIHLLDEFDFHGHTCMVFELYGMSVFDHMKRNGFTPLSPFHIWHLAKQLLSSVQFLHSAGLVHTDLKPENILFARNSFRKVEPGSAGKVKEEIVDSEIRLIDFGSATFNTEYHSAIVSTRHYRAPEIILGIGWSYPCDLWSIGCILVELYTGEALFQTHDNFEHLAMMEKVLGPIPTRLQRLASRCNPPFFSHGRLLYPQAETSRTSMRYVSHVRSLSQIIPQNSVFGRHFLALVESLLRYCPEDRARAVDAVNSSFFRLNWRSDGVAWDPAEEEEALAEEERRRRRHRLFTNPMDPEMAFQSASSPYPTPMPLPDFPNRYLGRGGDGGESGGGAGGSSHGYSLRQSRFTGRYC
ncbi:kinase-like domain-containing protein [Piptocephalis cylindrospora]|uniref:Kinase-like domain-containing protein n=1 Tax=Piptocephalis cylindrospora TaxID=1907219 RepID=A0A4P9Y5Q6_9FUNG|nr:kinase-like domain-containing protein [Piptocephalis cylindrospora]|eukprot:RKP14062.1 kinase-like domain-containing protein [Piptocephalis cylindrospora]